MTNTRPYLFIRSHKPKHPIFCPASRERTSDIQGAASFRWVFLLQEHATGSSDAKALLILTPDYVVLHRVPPVKPYTSWLNWISNIGVPISGNRQDPLPKSQTLPKQSFSCPLSARFLFAINVVYLTYHKKKLFFAVTSRIFQNVWLSPLFKNPPTPASASCCTFIIPLNSCKLNSWSDM